LEALQGDPLTFQFRREECRGGNGGPQGSKFLGRQRLSSFHFVEVTLEGCSLNLLDAGGNRGRFDLLRFALLRASHGFDFASRIL
jgi:hypothetical protein